MTRFWGNRKKSLPDSQAAEKKPASDEKSATGDTVTAAFLQLQAVACLACANCREGCATATATCHRPDGLWSRSVPSDVFFASVTPGALPRKPLRAKKEPAGYPTGSKKNPGSVLLSHDYCHSTIAAEALHFRVRDGNGCFPPRYDHREKLIIN